MARPREFDPEDAIETAMQTFWAKGYAETSMRDLVAATGVAPYGLYSTFEDKDGLFLAALDRYRDTVTRTILDALTEADGGLPAIRLAFDRAVKLMSRGEGNGCLMAVTAVERAPLDHEAADKVARHMALLSQGFRGAVERAQQAGDIPSPEDASANDANALADYLTATLYTAGLLLRAGKSPAAVRRTVRIALQALR